MKTLQPLILTARIAEPDLAPFDRLRQRYFPPDRNGLRAHLTMFHRLPGEYTHQVCAVIARSALTYAPIAADVTGLRHLGGGVAFTIASPDLSRLHTELKSNFAPWLGGQDMQKWQPHITVQNKVSRTLADNTHQALSGAFERQIIAIEGLDLWRYLGGPWQLEAAFPLEVTAAADTPQSAGFKNSSTANPASG